MSDIVELKPATPGGKARSFYLENEILQIDRLTMAIRCLATHPDDSPGDAYFGIALAIEECTWAKLGRSVALTMLPSVRRVATTSCD
jgi:hypothetical protein